jgi:hypothetical protein
MLRIKNNMKIIANNKMLVVKIIRKNLKFIQKTKFKERIIMKIKIS